MHWRHMLIAAGLACFVAPGQGLAQPQAKTWRVGFLESAGDHASFEALRKGMRQIGYLEGKNLHYESRFRDDSSADGLGQHAAELARLGVDVIVTGGTPAARAAQKATRTIPIIMVNTGDPVGSGLIASFARPGGNITGISNINVDINAKRVELLSAMLPKLSRVAVLLNPTNPTYRANLAALQGGIEKMKLTLLPLTASTLADIEDAITAASAQHAEALIVQTDSFFIAHARQIAERALRSRLPVVGPREVVVHGALMSYAPNRLDNYVRAATYVDKVLKGAKPADIPVEQPTKLDLTINLNTAKTLGIVLPREVLLLADELIP